MKLRQGNNFTSVCQEFCPRGGGVHGRGHALQGACMAGGGVRGFAREDADRVPILLFFVFSLFFSFFFFFFFFEKAFDKKI